MRFSESSLCIAMVRHALDRSRHMEWTTQGFGMIRTYLDSNKQFRLNVWDDRLEVPNVSRIHDHPWGFTSFVLAGRIKNYRYLIADGRPTHDGVQIVTGEDGGVQKHLPPVRLVQASCCDYRAGEWYRQVASELHETDYVRGTVTVNDRTEPSADHTATSLFPIGGAWVDAKPRLATEVEVYLAVEAAIKLFEQERP